MILTSIGKTTGRLLQPFHYEQFILKLSTPRRCGDSGPDGVQSSTETPCVRGCTRALTRRFLFDRHPYDLSNLDRWYERDAGERIGSSILYRVRLRPAEITRELRFGNQSLSAVPAFKRFSQAALKSATEYAPAPNRNVVVKP